MKIGNNNEIQSMKDIGSLSTHENEQMFAEYICHKFPDIKGFSDKNLWRMKQFYETYAEDAEKLSPLVRQISWTNNCIILSRAKSLQEKEFYLNLCILAYYGGRVSTLFARQDAPPTEDEGNRRGNGSVRQ